MVFISLIIFITEAKVKWKIVIVSRDGGTERLNRMLQVSCSKYDIKLSSNCVNHIRRK